MENQQNIRRFLIILKHEPCIYCNDFRSYINIDDDYMILNNILSEYQDKNNYEVIEVNEIMRGFPLNKLMNMSISESSKYLKRLYFNIKII